MTTTIEKVLRLLLSQRRVNEVSQCTGVSCSECQHYPRHLIFKALSDHQPLTLVLPAFPAKSANRQKTLSDKPDRAEIMGLSNLNQWCKAMQEVYQPGIKLLICSDGRVFNDLVLVTDLNVTAYQQGIQEIINNYELTHLSTFSLDEVYSASDYQVMRELLMLEFGQSLAELKQQINTDPALRYQFNGIHRFVLEDRMALHPEKTKNQVRNESKQVAYEVIRRSNAWSRLLARHFPEALRLSIHPQPCGAEKIGIQFLPAANRWATPWHNVLLKNTDGWCLVKRHEAEQLGAQLNDDHYVLESA